jgi:hypothetical protein
VIGWMASDPATGSTGAKRVSDVDLVVASGEGVQSTIYTTQHHRLWNSSRGEWVEARDLLEGDTFKSFDGSLMIVVRVSRYGGRRWMFDLTVDGHH